VGEAMSQHELKVEPQWLDRLLDGTKTAEVRRHDRDFQKGDLVTFVEYRDDKEATVYIRRTVDMKITHVLHGGQVNGVSDSFCVLSLRRVDGR